MATQIQLKRGLSTNFDSVLLKNGEPAFLTDLGKFYIGDGTNKVLINPINKPVGINITDFSTKVKVNDFGQVIETSKTTAEDIPDLPVNKIIGLGTSATLDVGIESGNIPVLDDNGKLVSSILPQLAITNTFVVASEKEMLALDALVGDIAIRTDIKESFILQTEPADNIDNWIKLLTPTDSVLSVNGQTGIVTLNGTNINLTGYIKPGSYTAVTDKDNTSSAIGKLETNFSNYATLASPNLTGAPTSPTAILGDKSTLIATTEFVHNSLLTIDGGIF